eukprot:scaffold880_cov384-Prasinococcus_capsulatus_cf.AAC.15
MMPPPSRSLLATPPPQPRSTSSRPPARCAPCLDSGPRTSGAGDRPQRVTIPSLAGRPGQVCA